MVFERVAVDDAVELCAACVTDPLTLAPRLLEEGVEEDAVMLNSLDWAKMVLSSRSLLTRFTR
jgi:hypothetical protein